MTNKPLRAILWCAVSAKSQATEDKMSLLTQEAEERQVAEREGWQVVDVLRVPGHTRKSKDIRELARAMQKRGIDAFTKLLQHFDQRSFDILVVRDGSRFARTQTLHSYITEEIIDIGSRIYSLADGMIDSTNYRMWTSMSGFASATEIDNLKKRNKFGMLGRLEHGKPTAALETLTHRKQRDERGQVVTYAVREDTRLAWSVIVTALLAGESFTRIAQIITEQAIPPAYGDAWYPKMISNTFFNPITWGHIARYYSRKLGVWAFDVAAPLPDGVVIHRNTHEPYWTGELAVQIQNELRRRDRSMRGRAYPAHVSAFSGLVFCACCGRRMVYRLNTVKQWEAFTCNLRYNARTQEYDQPCTCTKKSIQVADIIAVLTPVLDRLLSRDTTPPAVIADNTSAIYEAEIAAIGRELGGLYVQRATVPVETAEYLNAEITSREKRIAALKSTVTQIHAAVAMTAQQAEARAEARHMLQDITVAGLWLRPQHEINQLLHALFAGGRILVTDGEVTGVELT